MHYGIKGLTFLFLSFFIFSATTCVDTVEPGPTATDFTKEKREVLGDLLKETIEQSTEFNLLNRGSKRDSVIVNYLQTLYDQATQKIRPDRLSNTSNRWNAEREWKVVVLNDEKRFAFSLPGGHFYVSTGFLGNLSRGYEIYYLMAFEAINISERHLIDKLIAEYSTSTLINIIEADEATTNPSLSDIVKFLIVDLSFEDDEIQKIDQKTGTLICETSIFDRFGIQPILEIISSSAQEQYRDTRPSYANRIEYLSELAIEGCGTIKSTGLYEKMVLKNLPK